MCSSQYSININHIFQMKDALKVLKPLLNGGNDDIVLSQACLVLFRRLDGGPADMIDDVVSEDVFPLLVQLLGIILVFLFPLLVFSSLYNSH